MTTRRLGATEVAVTPLGLGTGPLGNLYHAVDDDRARATVDAAWDVGVRFFDTAPHYGLGLAERRLGAALRERPRDAYTVSTKVGRVLEPTPQDAGLRDAEGFEVPRTHRRVWDFSRDGVRRSIDESLCRLGLDRVDIALLHDPEDHADIALREGLAAQAGGGFDAADLVPGFAVDRQLDGVTFSVRLWRPVDLQAAELS